MTAGWMRTGKIALDSQTTHWMEICQSPHDSPAQKEILTISVARNLRCAKWVAALDHKLRMVSSWEERPQPVVQNTSRTWTVT